MRVFRPSILGQRGLRIEASATVAEQIIRKLREAERMLVEGKAIPEVAEELGSARRRSIAGATSTAG